MFRKLPFIILTATMLSVNCLFGQSDLFFVFLNTNPDKETLSEEKVEELQAAHLQNIDRLTEEGIIKAAGPFNGSGGIFIIKAENINDANSILQTDPAIKAHRFNLEVFPLMLAHNDLCGAKKPYQMVTYQFIRLISNIEYFGDTDQMFSKNRVFMAELNNYNDFVISQGNFNQYNDGFLILDVTEVDEAEKIIEKHPAVKEGQLKYDIKSLWIAKGTFCKR